jgi:phage terminase large subunit-like protein
VARARSSATDPVTRYADDVAAGRVVAGRLVRLACERHLRDLKRKDLEWRADHAQRAIDFFAEVLLLEEGEPFILEPFQAFIVGALFGWYTKEGFRRFRTAYVETGKGSGKTPLAAGLGLYGLVADGEAAPEVYSAATTQDQASIAWKDAKRMVEDSPELKALVEVQVAALSIPSKHAVFRPLSAEQKGLDGKRPHVGIVDEFHEHTSNIVVEKIRAGTKRRRNALIFIITNSGFDRTSACWKYHQFATEILEGLKAADGVFAYVCTLDLCESCRRAGSKAAGCETCDDWTDEKVWPKVNPGLGTILPIQYLREQVQEAKGMPSKENIVLRLNFCVWTEQFQRWLSMEAWDRCGAAFNLADVRHLRCLGSLDMASRSDFAAWVKLFGPDAEDRYFLVPRFWLPRASIEAGTSQRTEADRLMLEEWANRGLIDLTEGDTTDYDLVEEAILADVAEFNVAEMSFDPHDVTQMVTHIKDAMGEERVIAVPQTMAQMSPGAKELEKRINEGSLRHGGHPVLRWMASNTTIRHGPGQLIKPDKDHSPDKIDGITATVTVLRRAIDTLEEGASVYDRRAASNSALEDSGAQGPREDLIDSW